MLSVWFSALSLVQQRGYSRSKQKHRIMETQTTISEDRTKMASYAIAQLACAFSCISNAEAWLQRISDKNGTDFTNMDYDVESLQEIRELRRQVTLLQANIEERNDVIL